MGNHPSAVSDDGEASIHRQSYTVRGDLYARAVTASTINARVVYARSIVCQTAQITKHELLPRHEYPQTPHRAIAVHTLNVDILYADEVNCKTLRCYDVHVGDGELWRPGRVQHLDRNEVGWDGKEDDESEPSDNESDGEQTRDGDRLQRKKAMKYGAAGVLALGGAALAYGLYRHEHDEEKKKKEEEELRRRHEEDEKHRHQDEDRRRHEDDEQHRRQEEERRRREEQDHQQHPIAAPQQQSHEVHGNYQLSSRNEKLWSDGNNCYLIAECQRSDGGWQESRLDLDTIIANSGGEFRWVSRGEVGNFSGSAQRWELVDNGNVMVADLPRSDGSMHRVRINLAEWIANEDGHLKYLKN